MRLGFRGKVFLGTFFASALSLLILALLLSWQMRQQQRDAIEQRLTEEARFIADALDRLPGLDGPDLDAEADRWGALGSSRVTFVDGEGRVVGDSTQSVAALSSLDNHASRPEVIDARDSGVGRSYRYSVTLDTDMSYVAVRAQHPRVRYVRLSLPVTDIDEQLRTTWSTMLVALAVAFPLAAVVSWVLSTSLSRRVNAIARAAERYSTGDLSHATHDYGTDELGTVARALDDSAHELGRRIEELQRDQAQVEAILSGMTEGVLVVNRQNRLRLINRAAQGMLRVDASAVGRPYLEVIRHPDIAADLAATLGGHDIRSRDLVLARVPGRTFVARTAPVSGPGGGAVLVLHDITDLRRADEIRRDFVANVSHELRTPLTAIRGYAEALLEDASDPTQARQFLEVIARHVARMERLVTDLLLLARLDARQEAFESTTCDLRTIFEAIVADLAPAITAKAQRVVVEVADPARLAEADVVKLQGIVRNLVENALNYSPAGTEVQLTAARDGDDTVITVADQGPGIPQSDLTRVFERFYRVDRSRARPGGTGLGLAIVKHLVKLHNGEVTAANRPEGGAIFTVRLPTPQ